ncbi:chemotaxis protein MotB [Flavobacterium sp. 103]|uniref:OmpA/MotB family protein n=1 Tax=unclassified Flavobacterium TaxID=196869 RepID=UPI000D5C5C86|nr:MULTISPECIES: OmpA family protein [unclassified Flavobacterium]PVX47718.1 chemotaxis protein MotB [Flavobacterium sp. 103]QKJ63776.1 OmpA family protein [Flavobacterium sp. M31R6]
MKKLMITLSALALLTSCVSKKEYAALEAKNKETQDLLNTCTVKLNSCLEEKAGLKATVDGLRETNQHLISTSKDMTILSTKGAENIEKALESIKEKDLKITRMQDALTKKDSVTLAVVTSLKSVVGMNDQDIEINVDKGVVFISISDKMLFKSGSYEVSDKAKGVLSKVAKVVNDKPDFECMVEGHTDTDVLKGNSCLIDNWDLSVKRSTAIIRILSNDLGVNPAQLIAAGRSSYVPLVPNDSAENKSKNRRTRIYVMPKIDQFYDMVEKEMKKPTAAAPVQK